jgi:hypothetical protein
VRALPEGLEEQIHALRRALNRLGAVNPEAPQEYREARERLEFLSTQCEDLEQAATQLRQVIAELDQVMQREFKGTFNAVAREFEAYFARLFNGGSARLELTDPDDLMNTGIDVVARPPGKRQQGLAVLSGGERALAAAALIFAILTLLRARRGRCCAGRGERRAFPPGPERAGRYHAVRGDHPQPLHDRGLGYCLRDLDGRGWRFVRDLAAHAGRGLMSGDVPPQQPEDTRRRRRRRERELVVLVVLTLIVVGGGIVGIVYGLQTLLGALPCLVGGAAAVLLLYGLLALAERWTR